MPNRTPNLGLILSSVVDRAHLDANQNLQAIDAALASGGSGSGGAGSSITLIDTVTRLPVTITIADGELDYS